MLQLHLSDQQFYCLLRCNLYERFGGTFWRSKTCRVVYTLIWDSAWTIGVSRDNPGMTRRAIVACSVPGHCLNRCWFIVYQSQMNNNHWNFNLSTAWWLSLRQWFLQCVSTGVTAVLLSHQGIVFENWLFLKCSSRVIKFVQASNNNLICLGPPDEWCRIASWSTLEDGLLINKYRQCRRWRGHFNWCCCGEKDEIP